MKHLIIIVSLGLLFCLQASARQVIKSYHAGLFYPSNSSKLREQLDTFFREPIGLNLELPGSGSTKFTPPALAIISPEARFNVCGPVQAQAFKAIRTQQVKRVFILAPRNRISFYGAALPESRIFQTPLGNLSVDHEIVEKLRRDRLFHCDDDLFATDDQAIELQLPFIRYTFGNVPIVPILVGSVYGESDLRRLAGTLKKYVRAGDLVVVSASFTHYGPQFKFQPFQNNIVQNIKELDSLAYGCLARRDLHGFMQFERRTKDPLYGYLPCCVLLAMLPEGSTGCLLAYDNCDNRLGTLSSNGFSISYMGIAFSGSAWSSAQPPSQAND